MSGVGEFLAIKTDYIYSRTPAAAVTMQSPIRVQRRGSLGKPGGQYADSVWSVDEEDVFRLVGSVGIGTGTPLAKLHVNGAGAFTGRLGGNVEGTVLPTQGAYLGWNEADGLGRTHFMNHRGTGGGGWQFDAFNGDGEYIGTSLSVGSDANVGIGTENAGGSLDIAYGDGHLMRFGGNQTSPRLTFRAGTNPTRWTIDSANDGVDAEDADFRVFGSDNDVGSSGTVRLRISPNGNVGIGERRNPRQELHVTNGNELGGGNQTIAQFGNGEGSLFLTHTAPHVSRNARYDDGRWRYEANGSASMIAFGEGHVGLLTAGAGTAGQEITSLTSRIAINHNAPVEIGGPEANVPSLRVWPYGIGGGNLTGWPAGWGGGIHTWDVYAEGSVALGSNGNQLIILSHTGDALKPGGGAWAATSDARLKTVDGLYEQGLKSLLRLEPVRFHYKEGNPRGEPTDREYIGLVAQDVQKVFPEAVSESDEGYLTLDSTPISYAVINAVKELKAIFDDLAARVRELFHEISRMKQVDEALGREIAELRADNDNLLKENEVLRAGLNDLRARLEQVEAAQ